MMNDGSGAGGKQERLGGNQRNSASLEEREREGDSENETEREREGSKVHHGTDQSSVFAQKIHSIQ